MTICWKAVFPCSSYYSPTITLYLHHRSKISSSTVHKGDNFIPAYSISSSRPQGACDLKSCTSYTFPWITTQRPPSLLWFSKSALRIIWTSSFDLWEKPSQEWPETQVEEGIGEINQTMGIHLSPPRTYLLKGQFYHRLPRMILWQKQDVNIVLLGCCHLWPYFPSSNNACFYFMKTVS